MLCPHVVCAAPKWPKKSDVAENVALRGKATQSSRHVQPFGSANSAIDGNRESTFSDGSCSHTAEQTNPWWRVDLLGAYIVTSITITNRGDCCAEKINGAGNSLQDHGVTNPVFQFDDICSLLAEWPSVGIISLHCFIPSNTAVLNKSIHCFLSLSSRVAAIPRIPAGRSLKITLTSHVEGRYVIVSIPGSGKVLTLCEVEVYGYRAPTGENLALQGKASQSSLHSTGIANNAIDGNRASAWDQGSCSHTGPNFNAWWRLDLGKTHKVFSVSVTNIIEAHERLNGAEIRIGDSLDSNGINNPRCALISSMPGGFTRKFQCNGMDGRYVTIVIPGRTEYLHVCEVEVYGSRLD
ncbi:uncharacterized protein [Pagrus major]|uniref:uncharacterized protein n=1 Tax=Pagrus major TaxID=143350 RepID=UPI003CC85966